jgi:hypothetical protein
LVWLITLTVVSSITGKNGDFLMVFVIFGFFMTIPVAIAVACASAMEKMLEKRSKNLAALSGVVIGSIVPVILYWDSPNKENAMSGLDLIAPMSIGAGVLWSISYFLIDKRKKDDA